jgi:hypothetical protein
MRERERMRERENERMRERENERERDKTTNELEFTPTYLLLTIFQRFHRQIKRSLMSSIV